MADILYIKEIIGENCITLDDGQKIYDLIYPKLKNSEVVKLDFSGVRIFASPFMNAAIGQLLRDIPSEELNKLLDIDRQSMTAVGLSVLRRVIQNAKEYYSDDRVKQAVDTVLDTESQEN